MSLVRFPLAMRALLRCAERLKAMRQSAECQIRVICPGMRQILSRHRGSPLAISRRNSAAPIPMHTFLSKAIMCMFLGAGGASRSLAVAAL